VEEWLFRPEEKSPLLAIGIAGWLLWRTRARLLSLPARGARGTAATLLAIGIGLFVWARLTGAVDLLLPSLASNLLAFAAAAGGRAGCRAVLFPALLLLLGAPIPAPIRTEMVWRLQGWTASGAAWLMQAAGCDVVLAGLQIRSGEYAFTVIESCSGLRGIELLTLVALVIRELFAASGRRQWLLVLVAPGLGFALNLLRVVAVVAVASSTDPEALGLDGLDHTPQGVAVLIAGTGVLYALAFWMAGSAWRRQDGEAERGLCPESRARELPWRAAAAALVVLGVLSVVVTPFPGAPPAPWIEIPEQHAGWIGEDLALDRLFVGPLRGGEVLHRRYKKKPRNRRPQVVDLFVGFEVAENPSTLLLSPKIAMPGHDWSLVESRRTRVYLLGLDADLAVASRDSERALVFSWRLRDAGVWRETPRSVLALESGPFRRERRRGVVRISTPLALDGPEAREWARDTLDRFIADFREELAGL
jgi:exosortase